jgi:hypothetical protein
MPISFDRTENVVDQLDRLSYQDGIDIKKSVHEMLQKEPSYYFTAEELAARIQPAAAPVQIEHVLSQHTDVFEYKKDDGTLYWGLKL